ncbi:MAG TPA: lasso peptide biosynthesis B2 protein [Gemmatimonadaceae bacterium]
MPHTPDVVGEPSALRLLARSARSSPVATARATLVGMSAAMRAPFWVHGKRLRGALGAQVERTAQRSDADPALVVSLRVANGSIRQLSRTRTAWKNTCLYRSVAQYLVLKKYGRSAAIRIGIRSSPHEDEGDVAAHSWVLHDGPERVQDSESGYEELGFPTRA